MKKGVCRLFLCTIRVRPDIAAHRTVYVGVADVRPVPRRPFTITKNVYLPYTQ